MFKQFYKLMNTAGDSVGNGAGVPDLTKPAEAAAPAADAITPTTSVPLFAEGDWRASLPDDLKAEPIISNFADVPSMVKSLVHAQKMVGAEKIPAPSKSWNDEDWSSFYKKIGVPEADKYEVALPKEAKFVNDDLVSKLKPIAAKAGILPKQLEAVLGFYEENTTNATAMAQEARSAEISQGLENLRKEYGQAFEQNVGFAKKVVHEIGGSELIDYLNKTGQASHPVMIKMMANIGAKLYSEGGVLKGNSGSEALLTPAQALEKANSIIADQTDIYYNSSHSRHKERVAEVQKLFASAFQG